jgi:hypothetical protein
MGIGVQAADKGLLALETNFRLFDASRSADVIVNGGILEAEDLQSA